MLFRFYDQSSFFMRPFFLYLFLMQLPNDLLFTDAAEKISGYSTFSERKKKKKVASGYWLIDCMQMIYIFRERKKKILYYVNMDRCDKKKGENEWRISCEILRV